MGLSYDCTDPDPDKHHWVGKFHYLSKNDENKTITELIDVDEDWVFRTFKPCFPEEVKKITLQTKSHVDRFVDVPSPKTIFLDKRKIVKARYVPSKAVRGGSRYTAGEAKELGIADKYGLFKRHRRPSLQHRDMIQLVRAPDDQSMGHAFQARSFQPILALRRRQRQ